MEVFDTKTETIENEHSKEKADDVFEESKQFNVWYESELEKKRRHKLGKPVETPDHFSYNHEDSLKYKQVHEDSLRYKQVHKDRKYDEELYTKSHHSQGNYTSPSLELYLQACLILLLSISKSLNDQLEIISKLSQSTLPLMSYHPVQLPMTTQHARH